MQVQQNAEDAGDAGAGGAQPHDAGVQRTAGTAGQTAEEGLEVAQVHAEDGRLGDAHAGRQSRGQSHGLDLGVLALEGNGQSGTALRHVGGAGQRQPVGVAVTGQLTQIDQGVHVVDTGDHSDRIQAAHDEGADAVGHGDQCLYAGDDAIFQFGEHGADGSQGQITGDEHGHQRGDEQVKHGGHHLVQPLFDLAHEPHRDDDRDDVALIAHQRHRVQAAEHGLHHVDAVGNRPCVLQVGVDHDHADDGAQIRVAAEHLGGRVGDEDGQEGVGCIGEQLGKHIHRAGGIDVQKAVVHHEVQRFHDAHQEAGGHDGGDDGHKDVAQRLDSPLIPGCLGGSSLLHVLFAAALDAGQLDELVVDLVHRAGAEDDLQLTLCLKDALGSLGIFQLLFVDLRVVCDDQTQAGGAMRCRDNILFAADAVQNLLRRVFVIHTASPFPECG